MKSESSEYKEAIIPKSVGIWLSCILFSALPLVLFLFSLVSFSTGQVSMETLWGSENLLSEHANAYLSLSLFKYAVFIFVHLCLCLAVSVHFIKRLLTCEEFLRNLFLCFGLAVGVIFAIYDLSENESIFSIFMVEPLLKALTLPAIEFSSSFGQDNVKGFLVFSIIFPSCLGVFAAVLASGSFHASLFFKVKTAIVDRKHAVVVKIKMLKFDVLMLSLVLVSSLLSAKTFLSMPVSLFTKESVMAEFYLSFAQALIAGTGILYSVTLIAVFAPGFIGLLQLAQNDSGINFTFFRKWAGETRNTSDAASQVSPNGIWGTIIALLAPALASPLFDVIGTL